MEKREGRPRRTPVSPSCPPSPGVRTMTPPRRFPPPGLPSPDLPSPRLPEGPAIPRPPAKGRPAGSAGTPPRHGTVVLGLTGAPASGKSTVAELLRHRGAEVLHADAVAHDVLDEPAVLRRVARALGGAVTGPGGRADRSRIAASVFGPGREGALGRLERILHPAVRRRLREAVRGARRRRAPALVLEVPLLFEAGADSLCDATVLVHAPLRLRRQRVRARGWSDADLAARERRMWPLSRRRALADLVLRNHGTAADLEGAVDRAWNRFVIHRAAGAPRRSP